MKLIKKTDKVEPMRKTTIWVVETTSEGEKRKQFSCYNTSLEEVEELLLTKFKAK